MRTILVSFLLLAGSYTANAGRDYYEYWDEQSYHVIEIDYEKEAFVYRGYSAENYGASLHFPRGYFEMCGAIEKSDDGWLFYKYDWILLRYYTSHWRNGAFVLDDCRTEMDMAECYGNMHEGAWDYGAYANEPVMFEVALENDSCRMKSLGRNFYLSVNPFNDYFPQNFPVLVKSPEQQFFINRFPKCLRRFVRERKTLMDDQSDLFGGNNTVGWLPQEYKRAYNGVDYRRGTGDIDPWEQEFKFYDRTGPMLMIYLTYWTKWSRYWDDETGRTVIKTDRQTRRILRDE
jgi:hypothetical protein